MRPRRGDRETLEQLHQLGSGGRQGQVGKLVDAAHERPQGPRVELLAGAERRRAGPMRRGEQPAREPAQRAPGVRGGGELVQLGQLPAQTLARLRRGAQPAAAHVGVEPVGDLRRLQQPGRA